MQKGVHCTYVSPVQIEEHCTIVHILHFMLEVYGVRFTLVSVHAEQCRIEVLQCAVFITRKLVRRKQF